MAGAEAALPLADSVAGRPLGPLVVDGALGEIGTYDTVIVVASFNPKAQAEDQRLLNWLRRMARFGADMGAIETGSEILAAAHLLARDGGRIRGR